MVRFHRYQLKDKVIREARKKRGELQYQGKPIAIYEDYSPEVMEQRAQYREVMAEMYKQGFKTGSFVSSEASYDGQRREQQVVYIGGGGQAVSEFPARRLLII